MSNTTWDEQLIRAVAALQTQCALLDQQSDQLAELSDIQCYRRIKSNLADYIAAHAKARSLPPNPLAEIRKRLRQLSRFFSEAENLHEKYFEQYQRFLEPKPKVSLDEISQTQNGLEKNINLLPSELQAIANLLSPLDWNGSGSKADVYPELLICAQGSGVDLLTKSRRLKARLSVLGKGQAHGELLALLQKVRERLPKLVENHARDREKLIEIQARDREKLIEIHASHHETIAQAAAQIKIGNHLTASQMLSVAGLLKKSNQDFKDLDYAGVQQDLAAQKKMADEAVSFANDLSGKCKRIINTFQSLATTTKRASQLAHAKAQLDSLRKVFENHWKQTTALPGSELEKNCRPNLEAAATWFEWTETELDAKSAAGKKKQVLIASVVVIAVLIVVIEILLGY